MGFLERFTHHEPTDPAERPGRVIDAKAYIAAVLNGPENGRFWIMRIDEYADGEIRLLWEKAASEGQAYLAHIAFARECASQPKRVTEPHIGDADGYWTAPAKGNPPTHRCSLIVVHPTQIGADRRTREISAFLGFDPEMAVAAITGMPSPQVNAQSDPKQRPGTRILDGIRNLIAITVATPTLPKKDFRLLRFDSYPDNSDQFLWIQEASESEMHLALEALERECAGKPEVEPMTLVNAPAATFEMHAAYAKGNPSTHTCCLVVIPRTSCLAAFEVGKALAPSAYAAYEAPAPHVGGPADY
jgi:hypothetical protein